MTNPIRLLIEHLADHIHAPGDAEARAWGLTVEPLPWGRRRIYDPRVVVYAEARRRRVLRTGGDALDRMLLDAGTRDALTTTVQRMADQHPGCGTCGTPTDPRHGAACHRPGTRALDRAA